SEVLKRHSAGSPIPTNWFVVTFDDVYENVYTNAWPVLRELEIPATLFLATKYLDYSTPFPFDDWTDKGKPEVPVNDWKPITTEQCLEMQKSGLIELGAHTHSHEDFRGRPTDFHQDLLICKQQLKTRFNVENPTFAFPYGTKQTGFSGGELTQSAKETGVSCCLTTEDEQVFPNSDPYDWGRFTAEQSDNGNTLAAKLEGYFTVLKNMWQKCPV
ncbi:MAG: polysaccharide deacetylase family protein, partial [Planctomycetaceae bacterium]|nr:polysaccharide deacetylase family protein [Planctomycetaceae bacterium]